MRARTHGRTNAQTWAVAAERRRNVQRSDGASLAYLVSCRDWAAAAQAMLGARRHGGTAYDCYCCTIAPHLTAICLNLLFIIVCSVVPIFPNHSYRSSIISYHEDTHARPALELGLLQPGCGRARTHCSTALPPPSRPRPPPAHRPEMMCTRRGACRYFSCRLRLLFLRLGCCSPGAQTGAVDMSADILARRWCRGLLQPSVSAFVRVGLTAPRPPDTCHGGTASTGSTPSTAGRWSTPPGVDWPPQRQWQQQWQQVEPQPREPPQQPLQQQCWQQQESPPQEPQEQPRLQLQPHAPVAATAAASCCCSSWSKTKTSWHWQPQDAQQPTNFLRMRHAVFSEFYRVSQCPWAMLSARRHGGTTSSTVAYIAIVVQLRLVSLLCLNFVHDYV